MSKSKFLPSRSEVPFEETWDLESIFPTPADWEKAGKELTEYLPRFASYPGNLKNPAMLLEYLQLAEEAGILAGKYMNYASNYYAVDSTNQESAARVGQARSMGARLATATSFFEPELMTLGLDVVEEWVNTKPELGYLKHALDKLRRKKAYVRSGEVEEVLAMTMDPFNGPRSLASALKNADMVFKPAFSSAGEELEVRQSSLSSLINNTDRETRRTAWESYSDGYLAFKNTLSASYISSVKQDVFKVRVRNYKSSLHANMETDGIPIEVYHNLLEVFRKNLSVWHRYWRLRRDILGYEKFHVYDIKAPLSNANPVVPFKQAVEWICEGVSPLGEEVVEVIRGGCLEERWVDRVRNKGKSSGAFSSGSHGTNPFIMMSYNDSFFSLSTLAHELGHSIHSYYSRLNQPYIYGRYTLFEAEVASNFIQAIVRDYLFKTQLDRDFQIALIEEAMSNFHRYYFIMPTLAIFELETHTRVEEGKPLSAKILNGLMADLFKEGYGNEVEFDRDRIGITWAQFGHLFSNFYVYKYTTGIAGAHALAKPILSGDNKAVNRYLEFLKAGGSRYPIDNLKLTGVDLTKPEPVESGFSYLSGLIDRLEDLFP